jgi:hypothetical protein
MKTKKLCEKTLKTFAAEFAARKRLTNILTIYIYNKITACNKNGIGL